MTKRYSTDFNDRNPAEHLIGGEERMRLAHAYRQLKEEIEKAKENHLFFSRYYHDFWLPKLTGIPQAYIRRRFHELATFITDCEPEVVYLERILYLHRVAVEKLNDTMTPLKGLDLSQVELIQKPLFI